MFALIALVLFALAAFGVGLGPNMVALGLACLAAHHLLGYWPLSEAPPWRR